jgi:hypothetical protein
MTYDRPKGPSNRRAPSTRIDTTRVAADAIIDKIFDEDSFEAFASASLPSNLSVDAFESTAVDKQLSQSIGHDRPLGAKGALVDAHGRLESSRLGEGPFDDGAKNVCQLKYMQCGCL